MNESESTDQEQTTAVLQKESTTSLKKDSLNFRFSSVSGGPKLSFKSKKHLQGHQRNLRQAAKYLDKIQLSKTYLLCVDPSSFTPFRVNIGTQEAQSLLSSLAQLRLKSKIQRHHFVMKELLSIDVVDKSFNWQFDLNETVSDYRRSMVPFYLMEHEGMIYPRYVDYSDLSKNLSSDYTMNIRLYLSPEIKNEISKAKALNGSVQRNASMIKDAPNQPDSYEEINSVSLLHTATKLIKLAIKKIYEKLPPIKQHRNQQQSRILKFKNIESYLYGDEQLIYFQEIREHLRSNRTVELVLRNIEDKDEDPNFPPLSNIEYERTSQILLKQHEQPRREDPSNGYDSGFKSFGGVGGQTKTTEVAGKRSIYKQMEEINRLNAKTEDEFISDKFQKASIFFWYAPRALLDDPNQVNSNALHNYHNQQQQAQAISDAGRGYTPILRKSCLPFKENKREDIYSGWVNQPYQIKVLSLNNLSTKLQQFIGVKNQALEIEPVKYYDADYGTLGLLQEDEEASDLVRKSKKCYANLERVRGQHNTPARTLQIYSSFINYSLNYEAQQKVRGTIYTIKKASSGHGTKTKKTFTMKPKYVQVQAALYLGGKRISAYSYSEPMLYSHNVVLDKPLRFYKTSASLELHDSKKPQHEERKGVILVKDLPSNVRVGMTIIVLPATKTVSVIREGYIFGSVSMTIFDQDRVLRQGTKELYLWPFQKFDPKVICQGECYLYSRQVDIQYSKQIRMLMQVQLPQYLKPVIWKLNNTVNIHKSDISIGLQGKDSTDEGQLKEETKKLQQVKKMINAYPLEKGIDEYDGKLLFQYRAYVDILPAFVKSIDFTSHQEISICYSYLNSSPQATNLQPQEALALLDAQFGDERVRLFAVQKLSFLNDSYLSLYMPQLVQALKYEPFHRSPLSEFLLERSLKNTRVVGHAFFWALKANLSSISSHERFYLILERFLMCCGKFKYQLFQQNEVNRAMIDVYDRVKRDYDNNKKNFDKKEGEAKMSRFLKEKEIQIKMKLNLVITHEEFDGELLQQSNDISNTDLNSGSNNFQPLLGLKPSQQPMSEVYLFNDKEIEEYIKGVSAEVMASYRADSDILSFQELYYKNFLVSYDKEVLYFPFEPKKPIRCFDKSSTFFMSKQLPLLIVAELVDNADLDDEEPNQKSKSMMKIIFKYGDDLRQDNLVIQFFKLMDKLWLQNNLDLEMLAYNVMETGFKVGYIEFVDNSVVISEIHKRKGYLKGPFDEASIYDYFITDIKPKIPTELLPKYHDTFIKSLAGQCVATYILGIRDRHTGNFMLQKETGRFFHIDFGHFLGHAKMKLGIQRDREPFIYSPELHYFLTHLQNLYADQVNADDDGDDLARAPVSEFQHQSSIVNFNPKKPTLKKKKAASCVGFCGKSGQEMELEDMGKHRFTYFEDLCCRAFKILRQNAHVFINLMMLMTVGGINQLDEHTVKYLIDSLFLTKSDEEASSDFKKLIQIALGTSFRKYDNVFHNINDWIKEMKKKKTVKAKKQ